MYVCKDRNRYKNKACIEVCVSVRVCSCTCMYARIETGLTGVRIKHVLKIHNSILCYTQHTFIAPDNIQIQIMIPLPSLPVDQLLIRLVRV